MTLVVRDMDPPPFGARGVVVIDPFPKDDDFSDEDVFDTAPPPLPRALPPTFLTRACRAEEAALAAEAAHDLDDVTAALAALRAIAADSGDDDDEDVVVSSSSSGDDEALFATASMTLVVRHTSPPFDPIDSQVCNT